MNSESKYNNFHKFLSKEIRADMLPSRYVTVAQICNTHRTDM